mgnify:CR=1 FL=1
MKKIAFIGGTGAENSVLLKDVTEHICLLYTSPSPRD